MAQMSQPSNAEKTRFQVEVPETNRQPDRSKLSGLGTSAIDDIMIDIYFNQYLIDDDAIVGQGDYLVHSARLSCTKSGGTNKAYLRLEEKDDGSGNRMIGHGAIINGLPQADKNDATSGINIESFGDCILLRYEDTNKKNLIKNAASGAGKDVCTYIRKLNTQWTTPSESGLMDIGGVKAINTNSILMCNPTKIQAYISNGSSGGKSKQ